MKTITRTAQSKNASRSLVGHVIAYRSAFRRSSRSAAENQIKLRVKAMDAAYNRGDAEGLATYFSRNCEARATIKSDTLQALLDEDATVTTSVGTIVVLDDCATAVLTSHFSKSPHKNARGPESFVREDGQWKDSG